VSDAVAAARAVLDVLATGDAAAADHVLAEGAVLWHNDGNGEAPAKDGFAGAAGLHAMVEGLTVDEISADPTASGAVVRFELRGTVKASGHRLHVSNCMFATCEDGRITRIDEYIDPTFLSQLGL